MVWKGLAGMWALKAFLALTMLPAGRSLPSMQPFDPNTHIYKGEPLGQTPENSPPQLDPPTISEVKSTSLRLTWNMPPNGTFPQITSFIITRQMIQKEKQLDFEIMEFSPINQTLIPKTELSPCNKLPAEDVTYITVLGDFNTRVMTGLDMYRYYAFKIMVKNEWGMLGPDSGWSEQTRTLAEVPTKTAGVFAEFMEWLPTMWKYRVLMNWVTGFCDGGRPLRGYTAQIRVYPPEEPAEKGKKKRNRRRRGDPPVPFWQNATMMNLEEGVECPNAIEREGKTRELWTQVWVVMNASAEFDVKVAAFSDAGIGDFSDPSVKIQMPCPKEKIDMEPNCSLPLTMPTKEWFKMREEQLKKEKKDRGEDE